MRIVPHPPGVYPMLPHVMIHSLLLPVSMRNDNTAYNMQVSGEAWKQG